tara:strand:+ start:133 stop:738 length:606 start_codon:yes stop_codon:yes gene_type:complete
MVEWNRISHGSTHTVVGEMINIFHSIPMIANEAGHVFGHGSFLPAVGNKATANVSMVGVDLDTALDALLSGAAVRLEKRRKRYMFGCRNYGDVPGYKNDADQDPWDIFAPGYASTLPYGRYMCTGVLGVLLLDSMNHKIAVTIDDPGYDALRAESEIRRYTRRYCRRVNVTGGWVSLRASASRYSAPPHPPRQLNLQRQPP